MPPITNLNAVRFSNTRIRVAADLIAQLDNLAAATINEWNAQSLSSVITNTSDEIDDGASTDGRPIITGAKATNIISRLTELRGSSGLAMGAPGVRDTVLQVAVNPTRGV